MRKKKLGYPYSYGDSLTQQQAFLNMKGTSKILAPVMFAFILSGLDIANAVPDGGGSGKVPTPAPGSNVAQPTPRPTIQKATDALTGNVALGGAAGVVCATAIRSNNVGLAISCGIIIAIVTRGV